MMHWKRAAFALLRDDAAQDLVEYALILCAIALGCVASMNGIAAGVRAVFAGVGVALTGNV